MKTKYEIEMDFNRAMEQADELINVSKKLSDVVTDSNAALGMLCASWLGSNSGKFMEKGDLLEKEILSAADDLDKIAANIKKTAGLVYNAERIAVQVGY